MKLRPQSGANEARIFQQPTGDFVERRSAVRYALRAPVLFSWDNREARPHEAGGFTRDMSIVGAYIICELATDCPTIHSSIAVRLLLPPLEAGAPTIPLNAEGRVVRLGGKSEDSGFGLAADFGANLPDPGSFAGSQEEL